MNICADYALSLFVSVLEKGRQIEAAIAKLGKQLHSASSPPLEVVAVHGPVDLELFQ